MPRWLSRHGSSLILLAIAASALLALAACEEEKKEASPAPEESPAASPAAREPLKIGLLVDFTGALSTYGPDIENAARLAIDHINAAGGVLDQPVQLEVADSGTTSEIGVTEARRLVDIEKVQVIVGSLASSVTLAVAESVTVPSEVLQISPASTSPALTAVADDDYLFRTTISDAAQGLVLAKLIDEDLGFASVCTMFVNNPYGQGLSENFAEAFTAAGGQVSAQVPHEDVGAATTYSSELNQCVAGGTEALVAISYTTGQADVYLKEALEGGLINQFVFVDGTKDDEMFAKLGWGNFDGMKGTAPGALPPSEFTAKFDELYTAKYGAIYQVAFPREGYDAVMVAALAAEAAGSTDPTAIREALRDVANAPGTLVDPPPEGIVAAFEAVRSGEDIDYSGATGSAEFDDNGDVLLGAIETWRVDAASQTLPKERSFKVDLEAGTVEEIVGGGTRHLGPTADRAVYIGPVLELARRMFS